MIGGPWAVSWQGYLIAWPWAVLFIFSTSPTIWATGSLAERIARGLFVGTLTYIPVGIVTWIASITIFRNRCTTPVPVTLIALTGGIAWTTRSLAVIGYLELNGVSSDASPTLRFFAGFIQGALAFVLTAWLLAKLTSFRKQRRHLLDALVQEELANDRLGNRVCELQIRLLSQVRAAVDRSAQSMRVSPNDDAPTQQDVETLTQVTKQVSKDLAHELWVDASRTARVNPWIVVRSTVANRPFAYWALLPGAFLGAIALPIFWSTQVAVLAVFALTFIALVISSIANATCPRLSPSKALAVYLVAIALLLSTAVIMHAFIVLLELTPTGGSGLLWAAAVNYGIFFPLISSGAHIGQAQQDVLTQLRRSISNAEVEHHALDREELRLRRELALALHGGLQADLTASTIRAQQALDQHDNETARRSIDEARLLIQRSLDIPDLAPTDLRGAADSVVQSWEGFADISLEINVTREPAPRTIAHIKEILLEGMGNAVRHGRATSIAITIDDQAGDLRITIVDDGSGVTGSRIGLGSAMFDYIAPNTWSLTPAPTGGSTLTVELPTATTA